MLQLLKKIDIKLVEINNSIMLKSNEVAEMNKHMEDHKRDMDHLEKNNMREAIFNFSLQGEHGVENLKKTSSFKRNGLLWTH